MEKLELKKLSQSITNTTNKIKFCATLAVVELGEDEIDGLSRILQECVDDFEQVANTIELLPESSYAMQRRGKVLKAVHNVVNLPAREQKPA